MAKSQAAKFEPPTLIVIGEVVRLRNRLNWFETKPLFGKRILVTRPRGQAAEFSRLLAESGAEPVECPTIETVPPRSWDAVDAAIRDLPRIDWLIFTSVNGVGPFMDRLRILQWDVRALAGLKICSIGPRTAEELHRYGLRADLVPAEYQAEGVIEVLKAEGVAGKRILIPRAEVAREMLPEHLRGLGAEVQVVTVYRTVRPDSSVEELKSAFQRHAIDMLTFTSSSTVRHFVELFPDRADLDRTTGRLPIACIGPITAGTARELGLQVTVQAQANTIPALTQAIIEYYQTVS